MSDHVIGHVTGFSRLIGRCVYQVALRVQFPDRRVLQGFFRPLETGNIKHFIKCLDVLNIDFIVCFALFCVVCMYAVLVPRKKKEIKVVIF